jgi:hypothetical protein
MWPFKSKEPKIKYELVIPEDITAYELAKLVELKWKLFHCVNIVDNILVGEEWVNKNTNSAMRRLFVKK